MNNKLKPALLAGGALGLLLVLTVTVGAFVPFVGCCNCLWPIAAGVLATMLYVKSSPTTATPLDGAMVGAMAGAVGGVIYLIVALPISYFITGVEAIDMQVRQISPDFPIGGLVLLLIGGVVGFVVFIVLATLGGLLGVPIFEKRKDGAVPPPPPQNYGGAGM